MLVPAPHATFSAELPPTTGVANERQKRADLCWRTESRAESPLKPRRAAAVQIEDERLPFVAAEVFELRPGLLCGVDVHGNAALSEGREGRRFGERFEPGVRQARA